MTWSGFSRAALNRVISESEAKPHFDNETLFRNRNAIILKSERAHDETQ